MSKTFDELFNSFLGRDNKKSTRKGGKKKTTPKTLPTDITSFDNSFPSSFGPSLPEEIKNIIDMVKNFNNNNSPFQNIDGNMEKKMDNKLGKPDKIEFFSEDGLFYEKRTWHTPNGDMVKVIVSDDPTMMPPPPKAEKPLQQQLNEAVENEEFEKAAAIRDKINKRKKG